MISVGSKFPEFKLQSVKGQPLSEIEHNEFTEVTNDIYKGKWMTIFFYPLDFTFVCPTEITGFNDLKQEFTNRNSVLLTASVDSEHSHLGWRRQTESLRDLSIPMLSDFKRELSENLGILDQSIGASQRAVFIVDDTNTVRFSMATDLSVGRNPEEVLRVLDALQTNELCPCSWQKGDAVL